MAIGDGKVWRDQRKWMMGTLSQMGMATKKGNLMEGIIVKEAETLCEIIGEKAKNDGQIQIKHNFPPAMNNVIMNLTTGRHVP